MINFCKEKEEKTTTTTTHQHSTVKSTKSFVVLECTEVFAELCVKDKML